MLNPPDYNSPVALKEFLDSRDMAMQKKFGQNFLVNEGARRRIVDALDAGDGVRVWEVGPGLGCMTSEILSRGASVTAFEIDHGFSRILREIFSEKIAGGRFSLVEGDVMKTWRGEMERAGLPDRFFGNLPYNVAATIIADTINGGARFGRCVVTMQREVAQRMAAAPNTESYSSFSVLCQWAYRVGTVSDLAGGSFWPVPNVASRAMLMEKRADFPRCRSPVLFSEMVRRLFSSRRKTVRNNLLALSGAERCDEALSMSGIDPGCRAEALGVDELLSLSDSLFDVLGGKF